MYKMFLIHNEYLNYVDLTYIKFHNKLTCIKVHWIANIELIVCIIYFKTFKQ